MCRPDDSMRWREGGTGRTVTASAFYLRQQRPFGTNADFSSEPAWGIFVDSYFAELVTHVKIMHFNNSLVRLLPWFSLVLLL